MAEIGLLYDQSETDELGIKLTAEQMNIDLVFLPFLKTAFTFNKNGYLFLIFKLFTCNAFNCNGSNRIYSL